MFTDENTEGFSAAELALLNEALAIRLARGEDEKNASAAINNAWNESATLSMLLGDTI